MGGFYGNITLRGPTQAQVADCLNGRMALVTPNFGLITVVFDGECDRQNGPEIQALNVKLTTELDCIGLALLVIDDDVLAYMLHVRGKLVDSYDSCPSYFDFGSTAAPKPPSGGIAKALCLGFGAKNEEQVEAILRSEKYAFQTERHRDLVRVLGLPEFCVGTALASFDRGEYPPGLTADQMMKPS